MATVSTAHLVIIHMTLLTKRATAIAPVRSSSQAKLRTWKPVRRTSQLRQSCRQSRITRKSWKPHCRAKAPYHTLCRLATTN